MMPQDRTAPSETEWRAVEPDLYHALWRVNELNDEGEFLRTIASNLTQQQAEYIAGWTARDRLCEELAGALAAVNDATFSHVDGRDLLAELHPRKSLDIKRRLDARETWFEGDWLSNLYEAMKVARAALKAAGRAPG